MDTSAIAMIGIGVALAGIVLRQGFRLDRRIDGLQEQMDRRFDAAQEHTDRRFDTAQAQTADLRERVARIEGILTGRTAYAEQALQAET